MIKITSKSKSKTDLSELENKLDVVNGRAQTHTLTAYDIVNICEQVETDLRARGLSKADLTGTVFIYRPGFSLPGAYKGRPITNRISCKRIADGWRLVSAEKIDTYPQTPRHLRITISDNARDKILSYALRDIAHVSQ